MFVNLDSECKSSMMLPVMVKKEGSSEEILIYALLDNQTDSSFISETIANTLGLEGKKIKLSLSTMSSKNKIIESTLFDKIQVHGYNINDVINLSSLYSREAIPLNVEHIPTPEKAAIWPNLSILESKLMPFNPHIDVGLLIGYDHGSALEPLDTIR